MLKKTIHCVPKIEIELGMQFLFGILTLPYYSTGNICILELNFSFYKQGIIFYSES